MQPHVPKEKLNWINRAKKKKREKYLTSLERLQVQLKKNFWGAFMDIIYSGLAQHDMVTRAL